MTNIQTFSKFSSPLASFATIPDMLRNMDLILQVEKQIAGKEGIIPTGIKFGLKKQVPAAKILREIKEMAQDNYAAVAYLLSNSLTDKILAT